MRETDVVDHALAGAGCSHLVGNDRTGTPGPLPARRSRERSTRAGAERHSATTRAPHPAA